MIVSYCKKCKTESSGSVCKTCGKRAPAASVRDVWRTVRVPAADGATWRSVIILLLLVTVLLFVFVFGAERLMTTSAQFSSIIASQLLTYVLMVPFIGLILSFVFLTAQGREEIRFSLDTTGAHTQTWHRASRLRSWARLQSAGLSRAIAAQDGTKFVLADERHMLWQDVNEIKYSPSTGTIRLYHTPHLAPLTLRIPPDEYDTAEAIVKKYAKIKE